jgi:UDP-N-acetylmuramoyl-L-alanyl-D-glutamate--2,6-diaminopimelate ligase
MQLHNLLAATLLGTTDATSPTLTWQDVNHAEAEWPRLSITGVTSDSRQVKPGSMFVALTGEHVDGHQFIAQAVQAGASAIVVSQPQGLDYINPRQTAVLLVDDTALALALMAAAFYKHPGQQLRMVGVTGTNGKTTVTHLIETMLKAANQSVGLIGTLGIKLGATQSNEGNEAANAYTQSGHTTPMAPDLQHALATMQANGVTNVVMEVSSHALVQHRVAGCDFNVAVITNLTQDHLDFHKTMDHYAQAKALLFQQLRAGKGPRHAVINLDDKWASTFIAACPEGTTLWTYGIQAANAKVRAEHLTFDVKGASFDLIVTDEHGNKGEPVPVSLKLAGEFSVYNALAALTAGLALNLPVAVLIAAVQTITGVPGRFEVVSEQPYVIVDYAHTPDGLENVLNAARQITPDTAHLYAVFGCGGDRDATKRPKMGGIAERLADRLVITSDNPRSEDPQQILSDILAGIEHFDAQRIRVQVDREQAIHEAMDWATSADDVIVVAGKGHEDYQILADRTIHFDDKQVVQAYKQVKNAQPASYTILEK